MYISIAKCKNKMFEEWHFVASAILEVAVISFFCRFKIRFWEAQYYNDMLTAIITFISIIISIFGILIPTVFTSNSEMINYFKENADISYFVNSIKNIIVSGIGSVGFICSMYLYDKLPMKAFKIFCVLGLFCLLVFLLGSYRYLSIMLRLLVEEKKVTKEKKYKKQSSEQDIKELNDILRKQNNQ